MTLKALPGLERAAARLQAALQSGRQSHAYLIVGPAGVGRRELARELAAVLLCRKGGVERCGECASCRAFERGAHPDYEEVGLPAGRQELPIQAIRDVQDRCAVKPVLSARRVGVLCDVERMSLEAANCFLKTLEEPPGATCFILVAENLWAVPETIVSRCQVIKLAGLPAPAVEQMLRGLGAGEQEARWLALRAWGSPGKALAFRNMGLPEVNRELAQAVMALGPAGILDLTDRLLALASSDESRAQSRSLAQDLLEGLALLYRDAAALATAGEGVELFNAELKDGLKEFADRCGADRLIGCFDRVLAAIERIGGNVNTTLALDDLFAGLGGAAPPGPDQAGG